MEHEDLGVVGFALVELVEAGARRGVPEASTAALCRLEERARASGTDWALGVLARSAALLCDGPAADRLYRKAIGRLEGSRIADHLARTRPCVWVAPWSRADGIAPLRDTLVLSAPTRDGALLDALPAEPGIANPYVGDQPACWMAPGVPHDSYLSDFLMRSQAVIGAL
ncbi:hypothetical protein ACFYXM_29185 [Streptomyces sp. NPDC002476]|uniref:hypothetical protein n=1 Tax=Streptomyces sp. NPDC002476 TaxID=3364648 RepID=UPI0036ABD783